jgi:hypothetical protein
MGLKNSKPQPQGTYYGKSMIGPVPLHFEQLTMDDDLLSFLQAINLFTAQESVLESIGYDSCVDYPDVPSHIYYEAYFHTLPVSKIINSLHARKGMDFDKPQAPLEFVAFCEALRRINSSWLELTKKRLSEVPGAASRVILQLLQENRHFAGV